MLSGLQLLEVTAGTQSAPHNAIHATGRDESRDLNDVENMQCFHPVESDVPHTRLCAVSAEVRLHLAFHLTALLGYLQGFSAVRKASCQDVWSIEYVKTTATFHTCLFM